MRYIVLAIPVFLLLIALELVITRLQEKDYYRLSDSISDLGCGILQQLLEVFVKTALFAGYQAAGELEPGVGQPPLLGGAGGEGPAVLLSLVALTARLEDRSWAPALEATRLVVAGLAAAAFLLGAL